jgi:hypothetical protein
MLQELEQALSANENVAGNNNNNDNNNINNEAIRFEMAKELGAVRLCGLSSM